MSEDYRALALDELHVDGLDPHGRVSEHFRVYELCASEIAARQGIDNAFRDDAVLRAAVHLARTVLEPIRERFGPFSPNSVYRGQALERALKDKPNGWISTSQHTRGCACDVEIAGVSTLDLAAWARDTLDSYDQIICECHDPALGPNSGWVHVSRLPPGGADRREVLSYVRDPRSRRFVYVRGLHASPP